MTNALTDIQIARQIAKEAGNILLSLQADNSVDNKQKGKNGDYAANQAIINSLKNLRPDDGILSEEEKDNFDRLEKGRVWIIDPLDGTREYSENRDDWAVHIGFCTNGIPTMGVVALPGLKKTYSSSDICELKPLARNPKILISRTRQPKYAAELADFLGAELLPMGSAGAKAMAVINGDADIYYHIGGQHEWDNCAPVAVCLAHGLHCSRLDGSPITYNQKDTFVPDLLICRKEYADKILNFLRPVLAGE